MKVSAGRSAIIGAAACFAGIALGAAGPLTRQQSDSLQRKIVAIVDFGARPPARLLHRTTVTEDEVNAYLVYAAAGDIPAGVVSPGVTIIGAGRVSGRAVVDLDAVRKQQNPTSMLDPMSYLTGRLPITASGVLKTSAGVGRFQFESASIGSVPVPKFLLQEIVSYYSRSPNRPGGISLDDPFALPARIREIQVERGQAIIVQ